MLQVHESEISLHKWSDGTAQYFRGNTDCSLCLFFEARLDLSVVLQLRANAGWKPYWGFW